MWSNKTVFALISVIIFWASALVGIREGLLSYSPGALALLRFIIASICMGLVYWFLPDKRYIPFLDKVKLLSLGIIGIGLYNLLLNYGEISITAGPAAFIIGLIPVITVVMSVIFLNERLDKKIVVGIVVSLLGLSIMLFAENQQVPSFFPLVCLLVAALTGAVYVVFQKRLLVRHHFIVSTAWAMWGSTLSLLIFLPNLAHEIVHARLAATFAGVYLGIFPAALAYLAWSYVLRSVPASIAAMFLYSVPMVTIVMAFVFLHETISVFTLIGGGIAMLGGLATSYFRSNDFSVQTSGRIDQ